MKNKEFFFSTVSNRGNKSLYEIAELACLKREKIDKKNILSKVKFKYSKIKFLHIFLAFLSLYLFFFSKKKFYEFEYKGIFFTKSVLAQCYRDLRCYNSKIILILKYIKLTLFAFQAINFTFDNLKKIRSAYVDHGCYFNGIYFEILLNNKIKIYQHDYPWDLVCHLSQSNDHLKFEDSLFIQNEKISILNQNLGINTLKKILSNSNNLTYMNLKHYDELKEIKEFDFDYILYAHSFTDAQNNLGYDGAFHNTYEWLLFTLENLKNKKVCIKAHPNFFSSTEQGSSASGDMYIFEKIVKKFKNIFYFLNTPVKNIDLLKKLSINKTILITHHGTVALEGALFGMKVISSTASYWKNLPISNTWNNKDSYKKLLSLDHKDLNHSNLENLKKISYKLFNSINSQYLDNSWHKVIANFMNVDFSEVYENPNLLKNLSESSFEKLGDLIAKKQNINYLNVN